MFKRQLNECSIHLDIDPVDPILIKSGIQTIDGPDLNFVQTYRNGKPEYYLPGSSLKGVVRSQAERIARTVLGDGCVCMPFKTKSEADLSCGIRFDETKKKLPGRKDPSPEITYQYSCLICRLFGSTYMQGRLGISDAYPIGDVKAEVRDGVGIDRFTGGASSGAKFNLEVVTAGTFSCRIDLRNFELWQLGLLAYVLQDLQDAYLWIGSGKSRGLGRVRGTVIKGHLAYLGLHRPTDGHIWGVGHCLAQTPGSEDTPSRDEDSQKSNAYGFRSPDMIEGIGTYQRRGLRSSWAFDGETFPPLAEQAAIQWNKLAEDIDEKPDTYNWPHAFANAWS